jgi:hypothetical protein
MLVQPARRPDGEQVSEDERHSHVRHWHKTHAGLGRPGTPAVNALGSQKKTPLGKPDPIAPATAFLVVIRSGWRGHARNVFVELVDILRSRRGYDAEAAALARGAWAGGSAAIAVVAAVSQVRPGRMPGARAAERTKACSLDTSWGSACWFSSVNIWVSLFER